jgi:PAS domain S-box-containing protein
MIFSTDVDGLLTSFGEGGGKILGYTWEEVAGTSIQDYASDPQGFEDLLSAAKGAERHAREEMSFRHKQGHSVHFSVILVPLTNTKGETIGTVGICRDITDAMKLQKDLVRIDRLSEVGRIAADIVHEINNPVAVINEITGWIKTIVTDAQGLSPEDREELEIALTRVGEQTQRCRDITSQLLGFVRKRAPHTKAFDIRDILEKTISFLKPELKHSNVEIVLDFADGPLMVESDGRMLEQVFVNLLSNAIHAIRDKGAEEGRIHLTGSIVDAEAEILISDTGTGIPEEDREKVFGLFFTTKPADKGTGLGLPICRNIIRKLGGDITFESRPGEGTSFKVRIPA